MNIIQIHIELGRIESEDVVYIPQKVLIKDREKFLDKDVISGDIVIGKILHVYEEEGCVFGIIELQEGTSVYNIAKKDMYNFIGYAILKYGYNKKGEVSSIKEIERVIVRTLPRKKRQIEGENMFPFYQNSDKKERISMICKGCGNVFKIRNVWYDKVKGQMWRCVCGEEYSEEEYDMQRKLYVEMAEKQKQEEQSRILEEQRVKEHAQKALERATKRKRKTGSEEIVTEKKPRKKKDAVVEDENIPKKRIRKKKDVEHE